MGRTFSARHVQPPYSRHRRRWHPDKWFSDGGAFEGVHPTELDEKDEAHVTMPLRASPQPRSFSRKLPASHHDTYPSPTNTTRALRPCTLTMQYHRHGRRGIRFKRPARGSVMRRGRRLRRHLAAIEYSMVSGYACSISRIHACKSA